ncbi:LysR family transcriptional regulator [Alteromonas sp. McT4-15]|uniref:LysR family transcriptional regulator n=1 Tax=Alteromonas sp. McT4-15 TaxID=2881256 RepID=UPI001CF8AAFF|nr:LysR family transcriptional regulator [Alteromonas sp. McT4-15]MCB4435631.1 LysR family transcriptional regulator [Alteromonas sp. McT4-15]
MSEQRQFEKLDLNLLKVFEALWQHKNMTRVAEALHITPSAVSHAMRRFRDILGDPLFVKEKQSMLPTAACERLAPTILQALSNIRKALGEFSNFNPAHSHQRFVIAMQESLELGVLPTLLARLEKEAPNVEVVSTRLHRDTMLSDLSNRSLHLVIDIGRAVASPISHSLLRRDTYRVLMNKNNPLVTTLDKRRYLAARHITVSNRAKGASVEEIALQQLGVSRPSLWRCQNYRAAADVVSSTHALLTLPGSVADAVADDNVISTKLPYGLPALETHLYWHSQHEGEPGLMWLKDLMLHLFVESGHGK